MFNHRVARKYILLIMTNKRIPFAMQRYIDAHKKEVARYRLGNYSIRFVEWINY